MGADLSALLEDRLPSSVTAPKAPRAGVRLCLAVKYGTGAPSRHAAVGDLSFSVSLLTRRQLGLPAKVVPTESMLFAAHYCPLPEEVGALCWRLGHCTTTFSDES
jgi:hypothetical protein